MGRSVNFSLGHLFNLTSCLSKWSIVSWRSHWFRCFWINLGWSTCGSLLLLFDVFLSLLGSHPLLKHIKEASSAHAWLLHTTWHSWVLTLLQSLDVLLYPLSLLHILLLGIAELWLVRSNLSLATSDAHLTFLDLFHLLLLNALLNELVQLILRLDDVLRVSWHQTLYYQVRLLLVFKSKSEVL